MTFFILRLLRYDDACLIGQPCQYKLATFVGNVRRFPFVAVSIAFAVKKEVSQHLKLAPTRWSCSSIFLHLFIAILQLEFGVVYSCLEDKMYKARRGKGAFCNDELIQVSDVKGNVRMRGGGGGVSPPR